MRRGLLALGLAMASVSVPLAFAKRLYMRDPMVTL